MHPATTNFMGWAPDAPDVNPRPTALLRASGPPSEIPSQVDLSAAFPAVRHQGHLPACTAFAVCGLLEHALRGDPDPERDGFLGSALFVYKHAENKAWGTEDVPTADITFGLSPQITLESFHENGAPPEPTWPYPPANTSAAGMQEAAAKEPSDEVHATARQLSGLAHDRLDTAGKAPAALLHDIKWALAADEPCMLGFSYYTSVYNQMIETKGTFPYPAVSDTTKGGGHAIIVAGYDDTRQVANTDSGAESAQGAFLIRNSWGPKFQGDDCPPGYGWLPYAYVNPSVAPAGCVNAASPIARDVWALLKIDFD